MTEPHPNPRGGTGLGKETASPAFHSFFHSANGTYHRWIFAL